VKRVDRHRPEHRSNLDFHDHRFPGVTTAELREKVDRFGRALGRFTGLRIGRVSEHIFAISK
jgi:hypothetical protein